jgi:virginiamycin B lyase
MGFVSVFLIAALALKLGVQTPGVQIPMLKLKAEAEVSLAGAPESILVEPSTVWVLNRSKNALERIDPKANKLAEAVAGFNAPCGTPQFGFGSVWTLNCGDGTLLRVDAKAGKVLRSIKTGAGTARAGLAVSTDSVWALTDDKTTLSRIDPAQDRVVGELRLPAGCNTMVFGEGSLWVTCPAENRLLRIDPNLNIVSKRIEVSAEPYAVSVGEGAVWVFCRKDGKVERIDPKTDKVVKTIELGVPNSSGDITAGDGSVWVSLAGFPISRIDPKTDKVVQQFVGDGGGFIRTAPGAVWLSNVKQGTLWRLDPRRIMATLSE